MPKEFAICVIAAATLLTGCGQGERPAAPAPAARSGVFDGQLQALEKARGVEQTLQQQAQERGRQMEAEQSR